MKKREKEIVKNQLGRKPENAQKVVVYCTGGMPAVTLTAPVGEGGKTINPTIYWLTCPFLVREISRLEDRGLISELTEKLHSNEDFRGKMEQVHNDYSRRRMKLISEEQLQAVREISADIPVMLKEAGVGGIRDKGGIKCLHTHYADYLVNGDNPIGEVVDGLVAWPDSNGSDVCADCSG